MKISLLVLTCFGCVVLAKSFSLSEIQNESFEREKRGVLDDSGKNNIFHKF